jgi:hypothetical protein
MTRAAPTKQILEIYDGNDRVGVLHDHGAGRIIAIEITGAPIASLRPSPPSGFSIGGGRSDYSPASRTGRIRAEGRSWAQRDFDIILLVCDRGNQ